MQLVYLCRQKNTSCLGRWWMVAGTILCFDLCNHTHREGRLTSSGSPYDLGWTHTYRAGSIFLDAARGYQELYIIFVLAHRSSVCVCVCVLGGGGDAMSVRVCKKPVLILVLRTHLQSCTYFCKLFCKTLSAKLISRRSIFYAKSFSRKDMLCQCTAPMRIFYLYSLITFQNMMKKTRIT